MAKEKPIDERLDEVREEDGQIYVPRDDVEFDPDDGLLSGTAIDGTSEISDDPAEVEAKQNSDGSDSSESDGDDSDRDGSDEPDE